MASSPAPYPVPTVAEVRAICEHPDPIVRNLRITECYQRLSLAFRDWNGAAANWCTFAAHASRQAGATIRAEGVMERLARHTGDGSPLLHPIRVLWRRLLREGILSPETLVGRIVRAVHSPFDAIERASESVGRGNLKVFEEIGAGFARFMAECPPGADAAAFDRFAAGLKRGSPPDGQDLLREAFRLYRDHRQESDPVRVAQLQLAANLLIGLHEQTRLQPEIRLAMESGSRTAGDLAVRALIAAHPAASAWRLLLRRAAAMLLRPLVAGYVKQVRAVVRRVVTEYLMTLRLPDGTVLKLSTHLDRPMPEQFQKPVVPEYWDLIERFERCPANRDDCGARDWSDLDQRMHYILHLFRAMHSDAMVFEPPFPEAAAQVIRRGELPDGAL